MDAIDTCITGNLIMMLRLLKNTTFSTAVYCAFGIIKNVRTIFETSDARPLDALCDVNTEGKKIMSNRSNRNGFGDKHNPKFRFIGFLSEKNLNLSAPNCRFYILEFRRRALKSHG